MKRTIAIILFCLCAASVVAVSVAAVRQVDELHSPEEFEPVESDFSSHNAASLCDSTANVILDPQGVLIPFFEQLHQLRMGSDTTGIVTILHIGDSHVQAGIFPGTASRRLRDEFGDAGWGLIVPYKLAGMNEPRDYSITTTCKGKTSKATDRNYEGEPGPTGVASTLIATTARYRIWSKEPFNAVTVLHSKRAPRLDPEARFETGINCDMDDTAQSTGMILSSFADTLALSGDLSLAYDDPTFYGFVLDNGSHGVQYNYFGVNGATFDHYMKNSTFTDGGMAMLHPRLIIVSLGTNSCFGNNFRNEQFERTAAAFFERLQTGYPGVPILVTTPMESCKWATVRGRRTFVPNENIARAAGILTRLAEEMGMACWDLYNAAGGKGSNQKWYDKAMMSSDRIHLTEQGYVLQGEMLYAALADRYNSLKEIKEVADVE